MTFLFDHNLSRKLVSILQTLGVDAKALADEFRTDTPDTDWILAAGQRGWAVVTGDDRIRRNAAEREALQQSGITALFVPKSLKTRKTWDQALWFLKHWRRIENEAQNLRPGACARITDNGKLEPLP